MDALRNSRCGVALPDTRYSLNCSDEIQMNFRANPRLDSFNNEHKLMTLSLDEFLCDISNNNQGGFPPMQSQIWL